MEIVVHPDAFEINGERLEWQVANLAAYERHFGPSIVHYQWGPRRKPISARQYCFETDGIVASEIVGIEALRTMIFRFQSDRPNKDADGMAPSWGLGQFDGVLQINGAALGQGSRPRDVQIEGPIEIGDHYNGCTLETAGMFGIVEFRREFRGAPVELEFIELNWNTDEQLRLYRPDLL